MNARRDRFLLWSSVLAACVIALAACRRSADVSRAAPETALPWILTLAAPIDHLDVVAREPMILEHPDGSLFVGGFGASRTIENRTDELTLWKSRDGGTTWARVDVGPDAPRAQGAVGNSDMDLAVAPDGTIYFVTLFFDVEKYEGRQVSVGVSKDVGATWTWTLLSKTRFDDRPWVKVAPDGTAHVIWNDGAGVCHAVSLDGGLTWTERERIHPQGGSSHLAMGPNGEMAVRITPPSASGNRYDEGVDLIAVSTDRGMTWRTYAAPGVRDWAPASGDTESIPRWVEPLAWDVRSSLYSLWTGAGGVWLARSADQGKTWTTWKVADGPEPAFYPYLVARGPGELAATWFSARQEVLQAHAARIDVAEGLAPPRVVESQPFEPDCWQESRSPDDLPVRYAGGEYLAVCFLHKGGLAVVGPVQNWRENRFGFSLWKLEERRGEEAKEGRAKGQTHPGPAESEKIYSESPAAFYEAMSGAAQVSNDGKWALYPSFGRGIKLINLGTGLEVAEQLMAGMDRVSGATFYRSNQIVRRGERAGRPGWYLPGPDGPQLTPVPLEAIPRWSPDGSVVAYYIPGQADKGLFVGDEKNEKQHSVQGSVTGLAWSPDGRWIYATVCHENGLTSLLRLDSAQGTFKSLIEDLDAETWSSRFSVPDDKGRTYVALAGSAAPVAEARHQPNADRDLDIYELDPDTGARRIMVQTPGDDFAPCVADGFLYWTHNDIHDSVVVVPTSGGPARVVVDEAELPYWSPDGKQIAFTFGGWRLADVGLNLDAGVVAVDSHCRPTSSMKPIITGYHEDWTPAWSPDGQWLAFHSHRSRTPVSFYGAAGSTDDLYLRRVSGGVADEIRLTDFGWEDGAADWSPDGRRLAFDSWDRGGPAGVSKPWIVTIDPSTGEPLRVDRLSLPDPIKNGSCESWSPKGDEIAFEEHTQGNGRILWVVSLDGKRADKIVEYTGSTYGGLDWTPDGKTIVFGGLAGERMQIFAVPRFGGAPRQLTDDSANFMHPQVSPDGRWIACTRMKQTKEIRRLKLDR
jgi:Tol biopolymer transport system component